MENIPQSRRSFLAKIILFSGSAGLLWRYLTPRSLAGRKALLSVSRSDVPAEGALVYREARVAVMRSGNHVYALSLVCTHLGCTVTVTERGLSCPCHGSEFDRQGVVLKGPAVRALQRLKVEERDGMLEVQA